MTTPAYTYAELADSPVSGIATEHYTWCSDACYRDENYGDGRAGWVHVSAPEVWAGDGLRTASIRAVRFREDWTEEETPVELMLETPTSCTPSVVFDFGWWVRSAGERLTIATFPQPPITPCPDFCTEQSSPDHEWLIIAGLHMERTRIHRGVIGKTWRTQYERQTISGHVSLGRINVGGRAR